MYRLDSPLLIDRSVNCTGPVTVRGGTLLAGPGLASDRFLVEATFRNFLRPTGISAVRSW